MTPLATLPPPPTQSGPMDAFALFANPWGPRRPRSGVSSYRILMAAMFFCVAGLDAWLDSTDCAGVVGPASVAVWAFTFMGSPGIGPVRAIWGAARR